MPKKVLSQISDTTPSLGPGLFIDERARDSMSRSYCAVRRFQYSESDASKGTNPLKYRRNMIAKLRELNREYWVNRDFDNRLTFADMKPNIKVLRQRLRRLEGVMDELPKSIARALNIQASQRDSGPLVVVDHYAALKSECESFGWACTSILDRKNKKGRKLSVEKACAALWDLREAITGQPFTRTWEMTKSPAKHRGERGKHEFVARDPLFVLITLRAIDSEVTSASVRNGLKAVASIKSKSR